MDWVTWVFHGPARLIALWPHAGFVIGALLIGMEAWLYWTRRIGFSLGFFREAAVFAGLLWMIFNAYEWQVAATDLARAFMRYDLLVLVPVLYVLTAAALVMLRKQFASKRE